MLFVRKLNMSNYFFKERTMETSPALSLGLGIVAVVIALTGYSVYVAFGPPSQTLADPFDDHED